MDKYEELTKKIATIADDDLTDLFFEWKHAEDKKFKSFLDNVSEIISKYKGENLNITISDKDIEEFESLFSDEPEPQDKDINGFNLLHEKELLIEKQKNNFKQMSRWSFAFLMNHIPNNRLLRFKCANCGNTCVSEKKPSNHICGGCKKPDWKLLIIQESMIVDTNDYIHPHGEI